MEDAIKLARPEDVKSWPSLGLHLLVKNGESVVGRLVDCVGPYLDEVVAVLNDCEDDTRGELARACGRHDVDLKICEVTRESHPDLYVLDVPATYEVGHPLVGERFEVEHIGRPILAEWATARNVGWAMATTDWLLHLDADDVVADPECLPGLCQLMAERDLDVVATRYHYDHAADGTPRADGMRERVARRSPEIYWRGAMHECLCGYRPGRVAHVEGNLVVHDRRDSTGADVRISGRNLKILYYHARRRDWQITPREMIYLAAEARATMPKLAAHLIEMYLEVSRWDEEKAWAASMRGEIYEDENNFELAAGWYQRSLDYFPSVMAAQRLARACFRLQKWSACVAAYERSLACKSHVQALDGGEVYEDATKILVAVALLNLGRQAEASDLAIYLRQKYPDSPAVTLTIMLILKPEELSRFVTKSKRNP